MNGIIGIVAMHIMLFRIAPSSFEAFQSPSSRYARNIGGASALVKLLNRF
jgi:hypothetical protein